MRILTNFKFIKDFDDFLVSYPAYQNISYWWNYGILSGLCLVIQVVTGVILAMHYAADTSIAFNAVEHIMRDVNAGWDLRYLHANGASFFFLVVYTHVMRNFYYMSYLQPRALVWVIGVAILFIMILTAFLGYVLPWGQMSFWAATVITNLCSTIPFLGKDIVVWLWGGYSVDNPTLNRFLSFHFVLPFVLCALAFLHLVALHFDGSSNPLGVRLMRDKTPFHPYFVVKDAFGVLIFFQLFLFVVFFLPNMLGHPDNYIPANPLVTPTHIVPEWYFLPFYAILRSIPHKLGGVIAMGGAIGILAIMPFLVHSDIKKEKYLLIRSVSFFFFLGTCLLLGWIGGMPAEGIYIFIGRVLTLMYFGYFFFIIVLSWFDTFVQHNTEVANKLSTPTFEDNLYVSFSSKPSSTKTASWE